MRHQKVKYVPCCKTDPHSYTYTFFCKIDYKNKNTNIKLQIFDVAQTRIFFELGQQAVFVLTKID
jgi:hypothetical protein